MYTWKTISTELKHSLFDEITSFLAEDTQIGKLQLEVRLSVKRKLKAPKLCLTMHNGTVKRVCMQKSNWMFAMSQPQLRGLFNLSVLGYMAPRHVFEALVEELPIKLGVTGTHLNRFCRYEPHPVRMHLRSYDGYCASRVNMMKRLAAPETPNCSRPSLQLSYS